MKNAEIFIWERKNWWFLSESSDWNQ